MHYKNKRLAEIGHWVIGPTHNSEGKLRIGVILELIAGQGPCNVRMISFPWFMQRIPLHKDQIGAYEDGGIRVYVGKEQSLGYVNGRDDYADVGELIHVRDGFTMVSAVVEHGGMRDGFPSGFQTMG